MEPALVIIVPVEMPGLMDLRSLRPDRYFRGEQNVEATMRITHLVLLTLSALAPSGTPAVEQGLEQFAWLAGCWQGQFGEPGTVEHWLAPAGGTMLGMSRTVRQGKTVEFEFMQLRQLPDGTPAYVAQPSGRPPTEFRLLRAGRSDAVFENPQHDFPQRVSYARPEQSRLVAAIEGSRNGVPRRVEFSFSRTTCDAPPGGTTQ